VARVFLDTNILAYQFDASEPRKQQLTRSLLSSSPHTFVISTQVLVELFVVITRKLRPVVSHDDAVRVLASLTRLHVAPADAQLVVQAARTAGRYQLSVWDAMIVEAAADSGCEEIWTEDLQAGSRLRGLLVTDPLEPPDGPQG